MPKKPLTVTPPDIEKIEAQLPRPARAFSEMVEGPRANAVAQAGALSKEEFLEQRRLQKSLVHKPGL